MNMRLRLLAAAALPAVLLLSIAHAAEKSLVVHEWGTFTSLQDETGEAIGGINTNDEPVPSFVQRLSNGFLLSPSEAPPVFFQGVPKCHPDVTMRLETPVLYFYPAAAWVAQPIDVRVKFRGGWITEYFPAAEAKAPGFDASKPERVFEIDFKKEGWQFSSGFGHLREDAEGELWWKGVTLGADGEGPETDEKVWLAPRAVKSSMLRTAHGEREKFLFYRGVGHTRAALQVVRDEARQVLEIRDQAAMAGSLGGDPIPAAWLVDVRPDGQCAFRTLGALAAGQGSAPRATTAAAFPAAEYAAARLPRLQEEMRAALLKAGLFADEAEALLRTWEVSYFKSPGLRLFYLCTSGEIERLLPLQLSVSADLTRVMIGRIEIVTPEQRSLLAKIAAGPSIELWTMRGVTGDSQSDFFKNADNVRRWNDVMEGRAPYRELGLPIPEIYANYLALGRFRNALLLDEEKRRPTPSLKEFIEKNRFEAHKVAE